MKRVTFTVFFDVDQDFDEDELYEFLSEVVVGAIDSHHGIRRGEVLEGDECAD